jgi:hypothetical protein
MRECPCPIGVNAVPSKVHPHIAANSPTKACKRLRERGQEKLLLKIVFVVRHEHTDGPYAIALLRLRPERPRRHAAKPPQ